MVAPPRLNQPGLPHTEVITETEDSRSGSKFDFAGDR